MSNKTGMQISIIETVTAVRGLAVDNFAAVSCGRRGECDDGETWNFAMTFGCMT